MVKMEFWIMTRTVILYQNDFERLGEVTKTKKPCSSVYTSDLLY